MPPRMPGMMPPRMPGMMPPRMHGMPGMPGMPGMMPRKILALCSCDLLLCVWADGFYVRAARPGMPIMPPRGLPVMPAASLPSVPSAGAMRHPTSTPAVAMPPTVSSAAASSTPAPAAAPTASAPTTSAAGAGLGGSGGGGSGAAAPAPASGPVMVFQSPLSMEELRASLPRYAYDGSQHQTDLAKAMQARMGASG